MTPGKHHAEPVLPDRTLGELRDTILVILPGPNVMLVALHREPLDATVVKTILKYARGGINIDACRIKHANPKDFEHHKSMVDRLKTQGGSLAQSWKNSSDLSGASEVSTAGRWPPNVILVHGPGCVRTGTQQVPVNVRDAANTPSLFGNMGGSRHLGRTTEEIDVWTCQPDCPVRLLDEQSGALHARGNSTPSTGGGGLYGHPTIPVPANPSDSGGASRFFPTFPDLDAAQMWIAKLIGVDPKV